MALQLGEYYTFLQELYNQIRCYFIRFVKIAFMKKSLLSILAALFLLPALPAQSLIPAFQAGDVVALVGDSITHGGHYHSYIWLYYMTRFPGMPVTLVNCGVGGDEARSILERWDWDVARRGPSYVTLTFGMNDTGYWGIYGTEKADSLSAAKIHSSLASFDGILSKLEALPDGTRIVMIGGSPYDETSRFNDNILPGKNDAIRQIIAAQRKAAEARNWGFVDFNAPMVELSRIAQAADSSYSFCPQDRIHPDKDGQMVMAWLFLKAQGLAGKPVAGIDIDAARRKVLLSENCKISSVRKTATGITFDYLAEALPYPCDSIAEHGWGNIHPQRDALKMVPFMEEFNQEMLRVRNLPEGRYRLTIDDQPVADFSAEDWEQGVNMAALTNTPQYRQASAVMYLNEERFEIEKHLREYVWMEYNMFRGTDQLFKDDWKSVEMVQKEAQDNFFVAYSDYWYKKSRYPEIRALWKRQMDDIVQTIYTINQPVTRTVKLEKI